MLQTAHIPDDLRLYLPVYLELVFKNPVQLEDGTTLSSDDVVNGLTEDTIRYDSGLGIGSSASFQCGLFPQHVVSLLFCSVRYYDHSRYYP